MPAYLASCGCCTTHCWLRTAELYSLAKPEDRHGKSRCGPGHAPSGGPQGESLLCLFRRLVAVGIPSLGPHHSNLSLCARLLLLSLSNPPISLSSLHLRPPPVIQDDLIPRSLITSAKIFSPNKLTLNRFQGLGCGPIFWGTTIYHCTLIGCRWAQQDPLGFPRRAGPRAICSPSRTGLTGSPLGQRVALL